MQIDFHAHRRDAVMQNAAAARRIPPNAAEREPLLCPPPQWWTDSEDVPAVGQLGRIRLRSAQPARRGTGPAVCSNWGAR